VLDVPETIQGREKFAPSPSPPLQTKDLDHLPMQALWENFPKPQFDALL
jgi:hypothetical protein